jgi:hypothetical protein
MSDYLQSNIVERSYQLARSGACAGIEEIRRRLVAEGYVNATAHLAAAPSLKRELSRLCLKAQGKPERRPPGRPIVRHDG